MSSDELLETLSKLVSEERNPDTMNLDSLSALELVTTMNKQDKQVPEAIEQELPRIAQAVDMISAAFRNGGRLFYIGAGTSGRLGILDASECPPTFSVDESMVIGLIAGGPDAITRSQEEVEDSLEQGQQDLITQQLSNKDIVVGIAASGRTPYVIGGLKYAQFIGAQTVSISCNPDSAIERYADIAISPVVGPEVLSGSTRLKSGTAQKMILNMLTTGSMVRIGKSYQNLMVDLNASNEKLRARAIRIVMQATQCDEQKASDVLHRTRFDVKIAILIILTSASDQLALQSLSDASGHLRIAIEKLTDSGGG